MVSRTLLLLQIMACGSLLALPEGVKAHGFLAQPVSRNKNADREYCPHCYNGGGTGTVSSFGEKWPYPETSATTVRHGICGDAATVAPKYSGPQFTQENIVETYTAGTDIDLSVVITAHHMGWFEFRVCDKSELDDPAGEITQACLNRHQLVRAPSDPSVSPIDPAHPERFYTPPRCLFNGAAEMEMTMRYSLPTDLDCEHCVLQWYWVTANTCAGDTYEEVIPLFPATTTACDGDGGSQGWIPGAVLPSNNMPRLCGGAGIGYPEEFWNCADITILPAAGGGSTQLPTLPTATASPTTAATTATTTTTTTTVGDEDTPLAQHGKLTLQGTQLVGEDGASVQLVGMSSHGLHWFPDCYSKASIKYLVDNWGITLFRAAMYIGENGYATQPEALQQQVEDIVQWTKELGIYVMIDWHVLTPGDPNAYVELAQGFWSATAQRYKDEKHVLYEIANEPNNVQWSRVLEYHNAVIATIRAVDPETIVIAGTTTWSQDIHLAAATPVDAPYNVMYAFHFYAGTHASLLQRVRETAPKIPLFSTEWGTSQASGDGGPYLDVAKEFLDLYAELGISWAAWSYADKNEVSAALNPGACRRQDWGDASASGAFIRDYMLVGRSMTVPPTTGVTTMAPTEEATTAAPTDDGSGSACAALWGQCGGKTWTGSTCCPQGSYCNMQNEWYSQCVKGNGPADTDAPPTVAPTDPVGDDGSACSAVWKQCGGQNWMGPKCCAAGLRCNRQSKWYSQCVTGGSLRGLR